MNYEDYHIVVKTRTTSIIARFSSLIDVGCWWVAEWWWWDDGYVRSSQLSTARAYLLYWVLFAECAGVTGDDVD